MSQEATSQGEYIPPMPFRQYRWYIVVFNIITLVTLSGSLAMVLWNHRSDLGWAEAVFTLIIFLQLGLYIYLVGVPHRWPLSRRILVIYFGGSLLLFAIATWLQPSAWWVGFMYIGQMFGMAPLRFALPLGVATVVYMFVIEIRSQGSEFTWLLGLGLAVQILGIFLLLVYVNHLVRSAQERGQLVTELQRTQKELQEARQHDLELAALRERERLGRDLHDSLGHALVAISIQLEAIQRLYRVDPQAASAQIDQLKNLTRSTTDELRRSIAGLRTPGLGERSLTQAIQSASLDLSNRSGAQVVCHVDPAMAVLKPAVSEALWRVAQEALTNIEKHTLARHVAVDLTINEHEARLVITDDGPGLPPTAEASSATFGLRGMRERVVGLGGHLTLASQDGLRLEAVIPL